MAEEQIKPEKLTQETIRKLIEKAKETEFKYLLKIEEWARQGGAYTDYAEFETLYGDIGVITLEEWDAGYPYARGAEYLIIPKTIPVIILWKHVTDESKRKIVYIFTKDGWKSVEV